MERFTFDDAYVRRLRDGDPPTVEHFYAYFYPLLWAKLRSARVPVDDIPDVIHETFFRVLTKVGDLRDGTKLGAFVFGICNNVQRELWRVHRRDERTDAFPVQPEPDDHLDKVICEEQRQTLERAVKALPPRERDILRAVWLDEIPREEVCRDFEIDGSYLRVIVHRAIEKLRKDLRKL